MLFGRLRRRTAMRLQRIAEKLSRQALPSAVDSGTSVDNKSKSELITVRRYANGQMRSETDLGSQPESPVSNTVTFAVTMKRPDTSLPKELPKILIDWKDTERNKQEENPSAEYDDNDEISDAPVVGSAELSQTITGEHVNLILALCRGQEIPADKRRALYKALLNLHNTMMLRQVVDHINGSDRRIKEYLDQAEKEMNVPTA